MPKINQAGPTHYGNEGVVEDAHGVQYQVDPTADVEKDAGWQGDVQQKEDAAAEPAVLTEMDARIKGDNPDGYAPDESGALVAGQADTSDDVDDEKDEKTPAKRARGRAK